MLEYGLHSREVRRTEIVSNASRRSHPSTEQPILMICSALPNRVAHACFALCTLALIACPPAYAQSGNGPNQGPDIEDRWALQFRVVNGLDLNLTPFQGALISAKKQFSNQRAFRIGIDLNASVRRSTTERDVGADRDRNQNDQSVGVTAQWIRYPVHDGRLRAYWGLGPTVRFSRSARSTDIDDETDEMNKNDALTLRGGVIGALGAEWFVRSRISLSAEYRARLTYLYGRNEQGDEVGTQHQVSLGSRGVLVGVSLYF